MTLSIPYSLSQLLRLKAWLVIVSDDQLIVRGAIRVRRGDDAARQHLHDAEDLVTLGVVLGGALVDQDRVGIILPVGGDDVSLIARIIETGGCQGFVTVDGCSVHDVDDN